MRGLSSLFSRKGGRERETKAVPSRDAFRILSLPQMPAAIYAIGDVHGCRTQLRTLEAAILDDADRSGISGAKLIVLLGDVVDRGPESAGVIADLMRPAPPGFQRVVLRGNHEDKMLAFMNDPDENRDWLGFGGDATLRSYGLKPEDDERGFDLPTQRLTAMIHAAVPDEHRAFLAGLPLGLRVGPYFFCHAGVDPARDIEDQSPDQLMWGNPSLVDAVSGWPTIVHGHVITEVPLVTDRRINLDTGAYATGRLSCVRLCADFPPEVFSTQTETG